MNRRGYLAGLAGSVAGIAGCLDGDGESASASDRPLSEYPCPPVEMRESGLTCSHTVDGSGDEAPEAAGVYFETSPAVSADPDEITLTMTNDASERLEFNPFSWTLWVEQSGEWSEVEQAIVGDGYIEVDPGQTHSWSATEVADAITGRGFSYSPGTYFAWLAVRSRKPASLFRISEA